MCAADGRSVSVSLLGQSFACPPGQYLSLAALLPSRFTGGRIGPCPDPASLCASQSCPPRACNPGGGDCLAGQCFCRLAFTGADCAASLVTGATLPVPTAGAGGADAGDAGAALPPPPPSAMWAQVLQLSLLLAGAPADVTARGDALRTALAGWAELPLPSVALGLVAAAAAPPAGGAAVAASSVASSSSPPPSPASSASASAPPPSAFASSRAAQLPAAASTTVLQLADRAAAWGPVPELRAVQEPGTAQAPRPTRRRLLQLSGGRALLQSPTPGGPLTSATLQLTMPSAAAGMLLMARLRDGLQAAQLRAALAAAGFSLWGGAGAVAFETLVVRLPDGPPQAPAGGAVAVAAASPSARSVSRLVLLVAVAGGGVAVLGLLVAGAAVLVLRARRSKAIAEAQAKRAERYRASAGGAGSAGGADRYSGAGGAASAAVTLGPPPPPGVSSALPLQAAVSAGGWPTASAGAVAGPGAPGWPAMGYPVAQVAAQSRV